MRCHHSSRRMRGRHRCYAFSSPNTRDLFERSEYGMNITPIIPDGYNGPIKQLTCRICKHLFYITQDDFRRLTEVRFCHECSLILLEELRSFQGVDALTPSMTP